MSANANAHSVELSFTLRHGFVQQSLCGAFSFSILTKGAGVAFSKAWEACSHWMSATDSSRHPERELAYKLGILERPIPTHHATVPQATKPPGLVTHFLGWSKPQLKGLCHHRLHRTKGRSNRQRRVEQNIGG